MFILNGFEIIRVGFVFTDKNGNEVVKDWHIVDIRSGDVLPNNANAVASGVLDLKTISESHYSKEQISEVIQRYNDSI